MNFKPGDKVICIDDAFCMGYTRGKIYVVKADTLEWLITETDDDGNRDNGLKHHRFALAQSKERTHLPEFL